MGRTVFSRQDDLLALSSSGDATMCSVAQKPFRPGDHKGMKSKRQGHRFPAEVASRAEIEAVFASFRTSYIVDQRDTAIYQLLYRTGIKVGQIVVLPRNAYNRETGILKAPALELIGAREHKLDTVCRDALEHWLEVRRNLDDPPIPNYAPMFCVTQRSLRGKYLYTGHITEKLRDRALLLGIETRMSTEGLRLSGKTHGLQSLSTGTAEYVDSEVIHARYPRAYDKWRTAQALARDDAVENATRIGHDCREAMQVFTDELLVALGYGMKVPTEKTVDKLRLAIRTYKGSSKVHAHIEAMASYWQALEALSGTTGDLAQRQEHGEAKADRLKGQDGERIVFHTMLTMFEIDRALRP